MTGFVRGLVWAADGQGWFVSVDTTVGNQLLYVYLDGRFHSLVIYHGWGVPSPDGAPGGILDTRSLPQMRGSLSVAERGPPFALNCPAAKALIPP